MTNSSKKPGATKERQEKEKDIKMKKSKKVQKKSAKNLIGLEPETTIDLFKDPELIKRDYKEMEQNKDFSLSQEEVLELSNSIEDFEKLKASLKPTPEIRKEEQELIKNTYNTGKILDKIDESKYSNATNYEIESSIEEVNKLCTNFTPFVVKLCDLNKGDATKIYLKYKSFMKNNNCFDYRLLEILTTLEIISKLNNPLKNININNETIHSLLDFKLEYSYSKLTKASRHFIDTISYLIYKKVNCKKIYEIKECKLHIDFQKAYKAYTCYYESINKKSPYSKNSIYNSLNFLTRGLEIGGYGIQGVEKINGEYVEQFVVDLQKNPSLNFLLVKVNEFSKFERTDLKNKLDSI